MMRRIFKSKKPNHSNENNDTGGHLRKSLYFRQKPLSEVVSKPTTPDVDLTAARMVRIRLVFIRIGEIDTLNEKYQADIYYEARWFEKLNINSLNLTASQQAQLLHENVTVRLSDYNRTNNWTPQLFIENAIGQIGEQDTWFTIKKCVPKCVESSIPLVLNVEMCEHRSLKGVFWEKLELNHFPADVQDLTVSISSLHHIGQCSLMADDKFRSSINREAFYDQQEWKLYEHVATESRYTTEEYSFEDDDSILKHKKYPLLAVTCRAARRPNYYYWNGFSLIFLINACAFCIFSIPPDLPQSRLQITCTLVLTSVTFRWVVNRSLPTVSYLTALDRYAILSIILLVILCIWHSIIAFVIFLHLQRAAPSRSSIEPDDIHVIIDRYVFIGMLSTYIIMNISLIIWFICVPYKRRRLMEYLDREYASRKYIQLKSDRPRYGSIQSVSQEMAFRRASLISGNLPVLKSHARPMKHSDNVTIMSNDAIFLPIREETNGIGKQSMSTMELHESDDVFFDNKK